MMGLMAGVAGLPAINVLFAIAGLFRHDDEDPFEVREQLRQGVYGALGPYWGAMAWNGVPGTLAGIDLTNRIGMPDIIFSGPVSSSVGPDPTGRDLFNQWTISLLGAAASNLGNVVQGVSMVANGQPERGIETMAPAGIRNLMRAYRYSTEGVLTGRGDPIVERQNLDGWDLLGQALGFTPAKVAQQYEQNDALAGAENRIMGDRQQLVNEFALAVRMGDEDAVSAAEARIKTFNAVKAHQAVLITGASLRESLRARARNAARTEGGLLIQNRGLSEGLRQRLPERVN